MKKTRIIIIEDNRLQREGLKLMFKEHSEFSIVAALDDSESIIEKIELLRPDILLLDLSLTNINSLSLVKSIRKKFTDTKVIVMDIVPIQEDVILFVEAGASGFILKDASVAEFLNTIKSVAGGEKVLPPILTGSLFSQIISNGLKELGTPKVIQEVLMTRREREIVELISGALSNKEIAFKLNLSVYTVKSHVHNILEKMALNTRLQIAMHSRSGENYSDKVPGINDLSPHKQ
ncbi:MAG: response regulator transcription factor [Ignavibacteria bacterium]|nr:response regulator transcription factor [Ignavibacteria bacterium]